MLACWASFDFQRIRRCVLEKAWFVISVLFGAAVALAFGTNCGMEEPFPAFPQASGAYVTDSEEAPADTLAENSLCVAAAEPGKIFLRPRHADGSCAEDADFSSYIISRDYPKTVVLEGEPYVHYCIGVERIAGYITISHPRGKVTRQENLFTWCVDAEPKEPDYMIVRSLTPQAEFRILLE